MKILFLILAGVFGGLLGGMGMGGGTLLIPMLTMFCGVSQHTAQCINLVSFVPMAVVALVIHFKNKLVDFKEVLWLMIPAVAVSVGASVLAGGMKNELLARLFGGFLALLGIYQLVCAVIACVKKKKEKKDKGDSSLRSE